MPSLTQTSKRLVAAAVLGVHVLAGAVVAFPTLQSTLMPAAAAASPMVATLSGPTNASPGMVIVLSGTIQNSGNTTVTDGKAVINVPAGTTYVPGSSTAGCSQQATNVWCAGRTFAPGQSHSYTFAFSVNPGTTVGTVLDFVMDIWSANAEANWSNHHYVTVVAGGTAGGNATATFGGTANTNVMTTTNAFSGNNTQVWQQQQNNMPVNSWMTAAVNPTAVTTVNTTTNAGAQNNANIGQGNAWGAWGGSFTATANPTANTNVGVTTNAAAINETALWQQQQQNMPWGGGMNANINPTAATNVATTTNAGAFNTANIFQGFGW